MDKLEKRLLSENEMNFNPLAENVQVPKSSKRKAKLNSITCEFDGDSMIIDFASELRKANGEKELSSDKELPLTRESSPVRGKRSDMGINRMTGVLKNIEAMFNYENDLMDGYDMDDDFIDEDDEV